MRIPLLDHIIEQMATPFGPVQQKAAGLCYLVPSVVVSGRSVSRVDDLIKEPLFKLLDLTKQWEADLPCPGVVNVKMTRWVSKWRGLLEPPDSLQAALQACDEDTFPNVKALLCLACTMPVTSVDRDRTKQQCSEAAQDEEPQHNEAGETDQSINLENSLRETNQY